MVINGDYYTLLTGDEWILMDTNGALYQIVGITGGLHYNCL
jgi:hemin uptake protein HemP